MLTMAQSKLSLSISFNTDRQAVSYFCHAVAEVADHLVDHFRDQKVVLDDPYSPTLNSATHTPSPLLLESENQDVSLKFGFLWDGYLVCPKADMSRKRDQCRYWG
jgi:hypothetical protein